MRGGGLGGCGNGVGAGGWTSCSSSAGGGACGSSESQLLHGSSANFLRSSGPTLSLTSSRSSSGGGVDGDVWHRSSYANYANFVRQGTGLAAGEFGAGEATPPEGSSRMRSGPCCVNDLLLSILPSRTAGMEARGCASYSANVGIDSASSASARPALPLNCGSMDSVGKSGSGAGSLGKAASVSTAAACSSTTDLASSAATWSSSSPTVRRPRSRGQGAIGELSIEQSCDTLQSPSEAVELHVMAKTCHAAVNRITDLETLTQQLLEELMGKSAAENSMETSWWHAEEECPRDSASARLASALGRPSAANGTNAAPRTRSTQASRADNIPIATVTLCDFATAGDDTSNVTDIYRRNACAEKEHTDTLTAPATSASASAARADATAAERAAQTGAVGKPCPTAGEAAAYIIDDRDGAASSQVASSSGAAPRRLSNSSDGGCGSYPSSITSINLSSPPKLGVSPGSALIEDWLSSYTAPAAGAACVSYPGAWIDVAALASGMDTAAWRNVPSRVRALAAVESGEVLRTAMACFQAFDLDGQGWLVWGNGVIQNFLASIFEQYDFTLPSEGQVYQLYIQFDKERRLSLDMRECICLADALLRIVLYSDIDAQAPLVSKPEKDNGCVSESNGGERPQQDQDTDHPTTLAQRWVSSYKALPVAGTVSVSYSSGVDIQFEEFASTLGDLAASNASQRVGMIRFIESGDLMQTALQVYIRQGGASDTGYLAWDTGAIRDYVLSVFQQYSLTPPASGHIYGMYAKFAGDNIGMSLNTSECLCLVDALFRALFHLEIRDFNNLPESRAASFEARRAAVIRGESPLVESGSTAPGATLISPWPQTSSTSLADVERGVTNQAAALSKDSPQKSSQSANAQEELVLQRALHEEEIALKEEELAAEKFEKVQRTREEALVASIAEIDALRQSMEQEQLGVKQSHVLTPSEDVASNAVTDAQDKGTSHDKTRLGDGSKLRPFDVSPDVEGLKVTIAEMSTKAQQAHDALECERRQAAWERAELETMILELSTASEGLQNAHRIAAQEAAQEKDDLEAKIRNLAIVVEESQKACSSESLRASHEKETLQAKVTDLGLIVSKMEAAQNLALSESAAERVTLETKVRELGVESNALKKSEQRVQEQHQKERAVLEAEIQEFGVAAEQTRSMHQSELRQAAKVRAELERKISAIDLATNSAQSSMSENEVLKAQFEELGVAAERWKLTEQMHQKELKQAQKERATLEAEIQEFCVAADQTRSMHQFELRQAAEDRAELERKISMIDLATNTARNSMHENELLKAKFEELALTEQINQQELNEERRTREAYITELANTKRAEQSVELEASLERSTLEAKIAELGVATRRVQLIHQTAVQEALNDKLAHEAKIADLELLAENALERRDQDVQCGSREKDLLESKMLSLEATVESLVGEAGHARSTTDRDRKEFEARLVELGAMSESWQAATRVARTEASLERDLFEAKVEELQATAEQLENDREAAVQRTERDRADLESKIHRLDSEVQNAQAVQEVTLKQMRRDSAGETHKLEARILEIHTTAERLRSAEHAALHEASSERRAFETKLSELRVDAETEEAKITSTLIQSEQERELLESKVMDLSAGAEKAQVSYDMDLRNAVRQQQLLESTVTELSESLINSEALERLKQNQVAEEHARLEQEQVLLECRIMELSTDSEKALISHEGVIRHAAELAEALQHTHTVEQLVQTQAAEDHSLLEGTIAQLVESTKSMENSFNVMREQETAAIERLGTESERLRQGHEIVLHGEILQKAALEARLVDLEMAAEVAREATRHDVEAHCLHDQAQEKEMLENRIAELTATAQRIHATEARSQSLEIRMNELVTESSMLRAAHDDALDASTKSARSLQSAEAAMEKRRTSFETKQRELEERHYRLEEELRQAQQVAAGATAEEHKVRDTVAQENRLALQEVADERALLEVKTEEVTALAQKVQAAARHSMSQQAEMARHRSSTASSGYVLEAPVISQQTSSASLGSATPSHGGHDRSSRSLASTMVIGGKPRNSLPPEAVAGGHSRSDASCRSSLGDSDLAETYAVARAGLSHVGTGVTPRLRAASTVEMSPSPGAGAVAAAEQWVSAYVAPPLMSATTATYLGRIRVDFADVGGKHFREAATINSQYRERVTAVIENGDVVRAALRIYKAHDVEQCGKLNWADGAIARFAEGTFAHFGAVPPDPMQMKALYLRFDESISADGKSSGWLDASQCICFVDALFRAIFYTATVPETAASPLGPAPARSIRLEAPVSHALPNGSGGLGVPQRARQTLSTSVLSSGRTVLDAASQFERKIHEAPATPRKTLEATPAPALVRSNRRHKTTPVPPSMMSAVRQSIDQPVPVLQPLQDFLMQAPQHHVAPVAHILPASVAELARGGEVLGASHGSSNATMPLA